jgi:hypothetical protein
MQDMISTNDCTIFIVKKRFKNVKTLYSKTWKITFWYLSGNKDLGINKRKEYLTLVLKFKLMLS